MLYKAIHNPQDGDLIQYLGVYATRWGKEVEPTIAFIEVGYDVEGLCEELLVVLKAVLAEQRYGIPDRLISDSLEAEIRATIAHAETEREAP